MITLLFLTLLFIIRNLKYIENFSNSINSPNITSIVRKDDYLDITFEKDLNDYIQPDDEFFYELYYQKKDLIPEEQFLNNSINKDLVNTDFWEKKIINCDELVCNTIIDISKNDTYFIFVLINLNGKRSDIKEVFLNLDKSNQPLYSPNILQIIKKGSECDIFFMRSSRDTSLPKDKMIYEIYYSKVSDVSSISPSPSYDEKYDSWNKKKVICDKLKCVSKIYNLEDESYYFFIIQIKNGIKSMIDNVVEVSNEKPYKPIEYELEDYTTNFSSNQDTECNQFSYEECPDELTGTILSRCYKDKDLKKCLSSIEEKYLQ